MTREFIRVVEGGEITDRIAVKNQAIACVLGGEDGRTLFMSTVANTLYPASTKSAFNLGKDMQPIALLAVVPNVLVAHPSLNVHTVRELVALAKAKLTTW